MEEAEMHNQHLGFSQAAAEQRRTQHQEEAPGRGSPRVPARPGDTS